MLSHFFMYLLMEYLLFQFIYSKENAAMTAEVQLVMYSAIITTVPMQRLQETRGSDKTAPIVIIVQTFMDIVKRYVIKETSFRARYTELIQLVFLSEVPPTACLFWA